jgi:hypothetical protein
VRRIQDLPEAGAGAAETGHDGADGDLEFAGRFVISEILAMDEEEQFLRLDGEMRESLWQERIGQDGLRGGGFG